MFKGVFSYPSAREFALQVLSTSAGDGLKADIINLALGTSIDRMKLKLPAGGTEAAFNRAKVMSERQPVMDPPVPDPITKSTPPPPDADPLAKALHKSGKLHEDIKPEPSGKNHNPTQQPPEFIRLVDLVELSGRDKQSFYNLANLCRWDRKKCRHTGIKYRVADVLKYYEGCRLDGRDEMIEKIKSFRS